MFRRSAAESADSGFTIVETMIFLSVSALMFVLAVNAFSGKQQQTEFQTAVSLLKTTLSADLANVDTGNFDLGNTDCSYTTYPPTFGLASPDGTCTAIGEAVEFTQTGTNSDEYTVWPVVGQNTNSSGLPATDLRDQKPYLATNYGKTRSLPFGLKIATAASTVIPSQVGAFGIVSYTSFAGSNTASGSSHSDIFTLPGTDTTLAHISYASTAIAGLDQGSCLPPAGNICNNNDANAAAEINPAGGITICLNSGFVSYKSVTVTIGGNGAHNLVTAQADNNAGCT